MLKAKILPLVSVAMGLFVCAALVSLRAQGVGAPEGLFDDHGDIGAVLHAGSVEYNASQKTYTVAGSGENMWFSNDAFQFAWKKVSGDVTLTADIAFLGTGGNAHRKAVLMIRQSLDADSVYADVALHGSGLTSLQFRDEKGATTHEVQANANAPHRLRVEKRGDYFHIFLLGDGKDLQLAAGSPRIPIQGEFYVGIGVCSHDKDVVERAVFSNVDLETSMLPLLRSRRSIVRLRSCRLARETAGPCVSRPGASKRLTGPGMASGLFSIVKVGSNGCPRTAASHK